MSKCIRWSKVDEQFLLDFYPKLGAYECALKLNRTVESIRIKANRLGLSRDGVSRYNKPIIPKNHEYCFICEQILPESYFYKKSKSGKYGKKVNTCRSCSRNRARKHYNDNHSSCLKKLHSTPIKTIFNRVKSRAKKLGIEFNIDYSDIVIPNICPVLGIPIILFSNSPNSPSVDRFNPNKGYIKGNINIISRKANTIKNNACIEDIEKLLQWMKSEQNKNIH